MKKRLLHTVLCLSLSLLFLTGCHGSKGLPEFEVPETLDTDKEIQLTFWNKNDSNKTQVNAYKNAIAEFEKLYPNIHVTMKAYTDYSRIYNDVITNIATQTTPNVCITYPDHIATYMTGINTVVPLDDLASDIHYGLGGSEVLFDSPSISDLVPEFWAEGAFENNHYALPFMRSTEACYINEDMVHDLGYELPDVLTWDFVFEVSEKAMEQNADGTYKINNQNVMIPFIYKSTDNMMISMLKQKNAGYSTEDGTIEIFNSTTDELLKEIAVHAKSGSFSTFKISSYPGNFLNAGQCIFAIDSTAGATWMGSHSPNSDIAEEAKHDFKLTVKPIPQFDTEHLQMISQGPSLCIFNKKDPQEVLASWLFAQYLLTNDVQIRYAQSEGYVPVTYKAQSSAEYQEYLQNAGIDETLHYQTKIDATNLLLQNMSNTFVTPVFNGSASLRTAAGALIEDVTKAERRKTTVDDAFLTKEYANVTSLYRLDQNSAAVMAKQELGKLPATSVLLLGSLAAIWIILITCYVIAKCKKNRNAQK